MGKMLGDETANQTAKPLKRGGKRKKNHYFWNIRIVVSVVMLFL
jgi:hypothetical protein